jgi:endoglucanase
MRVMKKLLLAATGLAFTSLTLYSGQGQADCHLLPPGPLHTAGSQIVDRFGSAVRLACIAVEFDPTSGAVPMRTQMAVMTALGLNCIRTSINNASLDKDLLFIDNLVKAAKTVGLRIIIDNHSNENPGCEGGQQKNGLWFDRGPGSDGTDGCGNPGSTTDAKFVADWIKTARRHAGDPTVIGYDIRNEPIEGPSVWGGIGPTDIHDMYQRVGNAILERDPDKLIFAEGPIAYPRHPEGNLTHVREQPVVLSVPDRVVYSVHEYPKETAAIESCGQSFINRMNTSWGYLVTQNIAPVWIGEMATQFNPPNTDDDRCWADTLSAYLNGVAPGGLVIPPGGQGVGTSWWWWTSGRPYGLMQDDRMTRVYPDQGVLLARLIQKPISGRDKHMSGHSTADKDWR